MCWLWCMSNMNDSFLLIFGWSFMKTIIRMCDFVCSDIGDNYRVTAWMDPWRVSSKLRSDKGYMCSHYREHFGETISEYVFTRCIPKLTRQRTFMDKRNLIQLTFILYSKLSLIIDCIPSFHWTFYVSIIFPKCCPNPILILEALHRKFEFEP